MKDNEVYEDDEDDEVDEEVTEDRWKRLCAQ